MYIYKLILDWLREQAQAYTEKRYYGSSSNHHWSGPNRLDGGMSAGQVWN